MPKKDLHPTYYKDAKITCSSCGTVYTIGSTEPSLTVEVCAHCHPFYTGEDKFIDVEGRVERFQRHRKEAEVSKAKVAAKKKAEKIEEEKPRPKTLKEMLERL